MSSFPYFAELTEEIFVILEMPRIDPQQLLTCLKPLLAPQGGIKSETEVQRIASLMEKYSKKLVSKCIYIQILKNTEAELLDQFMSLGGWTLCYQWLNDGNESKNWAFVTEILEMFLLCPVESARLKLNKTPVIVKELDQTPPNATIKQLAERLVKQWLEIALHDQQKSQENKPPHNGLNGVVDSSYNVNNKVIIKKEKDEKQATEEVKPIYKISNKDTNGKLLLSLKRSTSPSSDVKEPKIVKIEKNGDEKEDSSSEKKSKSKDEKKKSSSSSSSSHKSSSKSSHRDKDRSSSSHKSSSTSSSSKDKDKHHKSSSKSSSSSSSRDKNRDKEKERERRKKEEKEKAEKAQAEKDKETLNFLQPTMPTTVKLQKIPKRQHSENSDGKSTDSKTPSEPVEKKKPSISIENRPDKPKTVKTLNSQFRDHGLAAEAPKPPSRKDIKKPGSAPSQIIASAFAPQPKAPAATSPTATSPPLVVKKQVEKAMEIDVPERAGGVKLIKPKPMLMESIGFMDALDALSSTTKKDGKKRKRLPSNSSSSKNEPESPKVDQKPLKFYKDTMEDEKTDEARTNGETSPTKELDTSSTSINDVDKKENGETSTKIASPKKDEPKSPKEEIEVPEVVRPPGIGCGPDGPPCVLVNPLVPRRKKRSLRWRDSEPDMKLMDVRLFELDENERANVTRTFSEQIQAEHGSERDAFQRGRNMQSDEFMQEQTAWRRLIPIDVPESTVVPGSSSIEAKIQADRERSVLQDIFFQGQMVNESPTEPDYEHYEHKEPVIIPATNESNPEQVSQFDDWPHPRGDPLESIPMNNAFGSVFSGIVPSLNIPTINLNPLNLNLNLGGIQSRDSSNPMWSAPPAFVQQPPPMMMPAMGGPNRGSFNNYNRSNSGSSNNNNHRRNTGAGGNWVRGNATKRGTCHLFKRTGRCNNSSCPYIHER